jgi:hypothetical protein
MNELNRFLKVLNKVGYPNPDTVTIAKMVSYNLDNFLTELVGEIGEEKSNDFILKAIQKLSDENGIRLDIGNNEYVYAIIREPYIDMEGDGSVFAELTWGDSNLLYQDDEGNEVYRTIEEISNNLGMGEWGDFEDMLKGFEAEFDSHIYNNCGFSIDFYQV